MNQKVIEIEQFRNIMDMLRSPDPENQVLAVSILEEHDFRANLVQMLLLKKAGDVPEKIWKENAPNIWSGFVNCNLPTAKAVSYKQVATILVQQQVPLEQIEFYFNNFSKHLLKQLTHLGYDFLEDVQVTIKTIPGYEQSRKSEQSV